MSTTKGVLSLFSGAGGLDIGLRQAGLEILAQVEMDNDCVDTLQTHGRKSISPTRIFHARIEDLDPSEVRASLHLDKGELALMAGGPPCQPFTTAGLRQAIRDKRASSAVPKFLLFIAEFQPRAILIENVTGILSAALQHRPLKQRGSGHPPLQWDEMKGSFLHWLLREFGQLGYALSWGILEAADYGVPQLRQRAFLVGLRGKEPCYLPEPMYGGNESAPYRTLREGLEGVQETGPIQPLSRRKKAVFAMIPPGGNWRDLPLALQRRTMGAAYYATGGKSGWWRRLSWNSPAPTILGMPDHSSTALIHPDEVRCLSVNECAAVQSFPTKVRFRGSARSQYQQIGNGVPPLLGKAIGEVIVSALGGHRSEPPVAPPWRQISANRRIGTHGWTTLDDDNNVRFNIIAKIRDDHVWIHSNGELQLSRSPATCGVNP